MARFGIKLTMFGAEDNRSGATGPEAQGCIKRDARRAR
jgi:hypothetical protein